TSNSIGFSGGCKNAFITVTSAPEIYLGIGGDITELSRGTIYDRGGFENNYSTGALGDPSLNKLLIQPCGAEEIVLNVSQLKFAHNLHALRVWDGINSGGIPLHPSGGFNRMNTNAAFSVVAKSGAMYLELNTLAGSETDSGLVANFEAVLGQTPPPI